MTDQYLSIRPLPMAQPAPAAEPTRSANGHLQLFPAVAAESPAAGPAPSMAARLGCLEAISRSLVDSVEHALPRAVLLDRAAQVRRLLDDQHECTRLLAVAAVSAQREQRSDELDEEHDDEEEPESEWVTCRDCVGTGESPYARFGACPHCRGVGEVWAGVDRW